MTRRRHRDAPEPTLDPGLGPPSTAGGERALTDVPVFPVVLGSVGDRAEDDADRTAAGIVEGRSRVPRADTHPAGGARLPSSVAGQLNGARADGTPLPSGTRAQVEPLLGSSLEQVRIHDDGRAHRLARELGASAFTHGQHVFFAEGQFMPDSEPGLRLLSHELAHTVQARGAAAPPVRRQAATAPAQTREPKVVRILVYRDLSLVTLRLDNGTPVTLRTTYNGKPNPGTYHPVFTNGRFVIPDDEIAAFGGTANAAGFTVEWQPDKPLVGEEGKAIVEDVVGGTGAGTGSGAGGSAPQGGAKPGPTGTASPKSPPPATPKDQKESPTQVSPAPAPSGPAPGGVPRQAPPPRKPSASTERALTDSEYLAKLKALPPEIKQLMGGEGQFDPGDYERLLAIAEKLKRLTPDELAMYRMLATRIAVNSAEFEQSLDTFFALKDQLKQQIDAQAKPTTSGEPTLQEQLSQTWQGFDAKKFATLTPDQKEAMARDIAAKQRDIELKHLISHPGEAIAGAAEGLVRPDKLADELADDVREMADGNRNGFARAAAFASFTGKSAGWIAGIAGVLFVVLLFVPGANLVEMAAVGLVAGGVAAVSAASEAELRIQAAKRDVRPEDYQTDVEKSAAAQANLIVQAALLAVELAAKLIARIPLGPRYQNVGNALRMARASLIRASGAAEALQSARAALLDRLRGLRGGLPEALAPEANNLTTMAGRIKAMSGTAFLEQIAAGDQALAEATGITPSVAKQALDSAKMTGSTAVADEISSRVVRALEDAPGQATRQVQQFDDLLNQTIAAAEKAQTPAELSAVVEAAEGKAAPEAVAGQEQLAREQYVAGRLQSELGPGQPGAPQAPVTPPAQPPAPPPAAQAPPETVTPPEARPQPDTGAPPGAKAPPAGAAPEPSKPPAPSKPPEPAQPPTTASPQEQAKGAAKRPSPARQRESVKPDPQAAEVAKQRVAGARQDLDQINAQRRALSTQQKALAEQAKNDALESRALAEQARREPDPAARTKLNEQAKTVHARGMQAADDANDLSRELDALSKDVADKEQAVRRAEIEADPKGNRVALPCFSGDTPVWTASGPRRIDTLSRGELVLSFDFEHARVVSRPVVDVYMNRTVHFYELRAGNTTVRATGGHRFWVLDAERWLPARALVRGMRVRVADGDSLTIDRVTFRDVGEQPSWNLAIEGWRNYFVGPGMLVHNQGGFDSGLGGDVTIYRATNPDPKFAGKAYIGQSIDPAFREQSHRSFARGKLAEGGLTPQQQEFYEFMSNAKLEPLVTGLANKDQADYVEQTNIDVEAEVRGAENVMNRRAQIRSETHLREVTQRIENDPAVIKAGYCRK